MTKPILTKQGNRQTVVTNAGIILAEISRFYPTISLADMAARVGRSESALQRWARTGRARFKDLEALIVAYPEPECAGQDELASAQSIPVEMLTPLFALADALKALVDNLRTQIGVQKGSV